MAEVKNKRILKEIAKRWAKGTLISVDFHAFSESDLNEEEIVFVMDEINAIANRITPLDAATDTNSLVEEYLE